MSSENAQSENQGLTTSAQPCRGCTPDCKFINKCEGTPWRMTDETVNACLAADTKN